MSEINEKAKAILDKAGNLVCGDREQQHGDMRENFSHIAELWTAYLSFEIAPHEVADMMELLKVARRKTGSTNQDDFIDAAGYAAIAGVLRNG